MKQSQRSGTAQADAKKKVRPGGAVVRSPESIRRDPDQEPGLQAQPETRKSGLKGDVRGALQQDTPGRAKSASSRQQTVPNQKTQTGSEELDGDGAEGERSEKH